MKIKSIKKTKSAGGSKKRQNISKSSLAKKRQLEELFSEESILAKIDLKILINNSIFDSLSLSNKLKLIDLLPECDRYLDNSTDIQHQNQITKQELINLNSTALNNEFIKKSCIEWQNSLTSGQLNSEKLLLSLINPKKEKDKISFDTKEEISTSEDDTLADNADSLEEVESDFDIEKEEEYEDEEEFIDEELVQDETLIKSPKSIKQTKPESIVSNIEQPQLVTRKSLRNRKIRKFDDQDDNFSRSKKTEVIFAPKVVLDSTVKSKNKKTVNNIISPTTATNTSITTTKTHSSIASLLAEKVEEKTLSNILNTPSSMQTMQLSKPPMPRIIGTITPTVQNQIDGQENKTKTLAQIKAQIAEKKRIAALSATSESPNCINKRVKVEEYPINVESLEHESIIIHPTIVNDYLNDFQHLLDDVKLESITSSNTDELLNMSSSSSMATSSSLASSLSTSKNVITSSNNDLFSKESDIQKIVHELKLIGGANTLNSESITRKLASDESELSSKLSNNKLPSIISLCNKQPVSQNEQLKQSLPSMNSFSYPNTSTPSVIVKNVLNSKPTQSTQSLGQPTKINNLIKNEDLKPSSSSATNGLINFIQSLPTIENFKLLSSSSSSSSSDSPSNSSQSPNTSPHVQQVSIAGSSFNLPALQNQPSMLQNSNTRVTNPLNVNYISLPQQQQLQLNRNCVLSQVNFKQNSLSQQVPNFNRKLSHNENSKQLSISNSSNMNQSSNPSSSQRASNRSSNHQLTVAQLLSQKQQLKQQQQQQQQQAQINKTLFAHSQQTNQIQKQLSCTGNNFNANSNTIQAQQPQQQPSLSQVSQSDPILYSQVVSLNNISVTGNTQMTNGLSSRHQKSPPVQISLSTNGSIPNSEHHSNVPTTAIFLQPTVTSNTSYSGNIFTLAHSNSGELSLVQASTSRPSQLQTKSTDLQETKQQSESQFEHYKNKSDTSNSADNNSSSNVMNNCECSNKPLVECIKCSLLCHENCINESKICSKCINE